MKWSFLSFKELRVFSYLGLDFWLVPIWTTFSNLEGNPAKARLDVPGKL